MCRTRASDIRYVLSDSLLRLPSCGIVLMQNGVSCSRMYVARFKFWRLMILLSAICFASAWAREVLVGGEQNFWVSGSYDDIFVTGGDVLVSYERCFRMTIYLIGRVCMHIAVEVGSLDICGQYKDL